MVYVYGTTIFSSMIIILKCICSEAIIFRDKANQGLNSSFHFYVKGDGDGRKTQDALCANNSSRPLDPAAESYYCDPGYYLCNRTCLKFNHLSFEIPTKHFKNFLAAENFIRLINYSLRNTNLSKKINITHSTEKPEKLLSRRIFKSYETIVKRFLIVSNRLKYPDEATLPFEYLKDEMDAAKGRRHFDDILFNLNLCYEVWKEFNNIGKRELHFLYKECLQLPRKEPNTAKPGPINQRDFLIRIRSSSASPKLYELNILTTLLGLLEVSLLAA